MNQPHVRLVAFLTFLLLAVAGPVCAADALSPADTAWKELRKAATPNSPPREWSDQRPGDEEIRAFQKKQGAKALTAADKAKDFYTQFPEDKRASEARSLEYNLLTAVVQLGDSSVTDRMIALQEKLVNDPAISADERLSMILTAAKGALQGGGGDPVPALLKAKEMFVKAFELFPNRAEPAAYLAQLGEMLMAYEQTDAALEVWKKLDRDGTDPEAREQVKAQLAKFDRVGKPLEISFTALDGRKVDVAELKGKVVMIDFWATWCGPCIAGLPELKEMYAKWNPQGFEIVGISLDNDEEALRTMVKEREMPWPQFFDRENKSNRYAEKFGITGIPTLWLIDKQGNLRHLNARSDMDAKIGKLIAEK